MSTHGGVKVEPRGTSTRLRWTFAGRRHATTVYSKADLASAVRHIEAADCAVTSADMRGRPWVVGATGAAPIVARIFEDVAEELFAARIASGDMTERTATGHRAKVRRMPWRRDLVDGITADEVNAWIARVQRVAVDGPKLERSTARQYAVTAVMVLHYATAKGYRAAGEGVTVPRKGKRREEYLTRAEVADAIAATPEALFADVLRFLAYTGARIGEALEVKVGDVNARRGTVHIRGTVVGNKSNGGRSDGKTDSADRKVPLDPTTLAMCLARAEGRPKSAPLFAWPVGTSHKTHGDLDGTRPSVETVRRRWRDACLAADVEPVHVHDLRHSHASWLLNDGVPLLVVSRRLGHAKISTTADLYGHITPDGDAAVMASLTDRERAPLHAVA